MGLRRRPICVALHIPKIPLATECPCVFWRQANAFAFALSPDVVDPALDLGQPFAMLRSGLSNSHRPAVEALFPAHPVELLVSVLNVFRNSLPRNPSAVGRRREFGSYTGHV